MFSLLPVDFIAAHYLYIAPLTHSFNVKEERVDLEGKRVVSVDRTIHGLAFRANPDNGFLAIVETGEAKDEVTFPVRNGDTIGSKLRSRTLFTVLFDFFKNNLGLVLR